MLEASSEPSRDLMVGSSLRNWLDAIDRVRVCLFNATKAFVTELVRIAYHEYGFHESGTYGWRMFNVQPLQPVWYGRLVMWSDGFQHRQFELTRFSIEHEIRRSRNEAVYKMGVSK